MTFSGKVVIVTGAASGIGAATAELFTREGATVVMVDKDGTKLQSIVDEASRSGYTTLAVSANVADDEDAKKIIEETIDKFGNLDILVNCAGIYREGSIMDGTVLNVYDEILSVNLRSLVLLTTLASPHIVKRKGNIINVTSVSAVSVISASNCAYNVSKAGVDHFTRTAALELASYGVRVNAIRPGPVRTNIYVHAGMENIIESASSLTTLNRISDPEEMADLILYLASDKAKGITGSILTNDNGLLLKYN